LKYVLSTILLFVVTAFAQQSAPRASNNEIVLRMPSNVAFVHDVSSSKARAGDVVQLKYFGELRDASGVVVLNEKARLYARISDVSKRDKQQTEARLGIIIERAEFEGKSFKLNAVFCGNFRTPPQILHETTTEFGRPSTATLIRPGTTGLPDDVELRKSSSGASLISHKSNIVITSDTSFYVCQQRADEASEFVDNRAIVPPASLPPGVTFAADLQQRVDSAKAKAGDPVTMIMIGNLRGPGNTIAIPKGAKILGRVVIAQPASGTSPSRLGIVAEQAVWDGGNVPLKAFVSKEPDLSSEALSEMLLPGKAVSVDLRQIGVEEMSDGPVLTRPKKSIELPAGCTLTVRQVK
jgi:hypothetical protein